jgi:hypothetical protein
MWTIRDEQVAALDQAARVQFYARTAQLLKETLPELTVGLSEEELRRRVVEGERKARAHGVTTERGITQFICLGMVAGPEFDEHPDVQALFRHPGLDPDEAVQALVDRLAEGNS